MTNPNPLQLFQKIVVDEFIRELQFFLDVNAGRATGRADFTDKLLNVFKDPILNELNKLPFPGTSILQDAMSYGIDWLNDKRKEGKLDYAQQIGYDADFEKLRILLEDVAMETANRYQFWISDCLVEEPLEGVIPFAKACVERMLEYVLRKKLPLTFDNLLHGLIVGRSGGYVSGYRNTRLSVREDDLDKGFNAKAKRLLTIGNYTAEGALARTGLQTYDDKLWALEDQEKTAQHWVKKNTKLSAIQFEQWFAYGYTKFNHHKDPKYGYIRVPKMVWQGLYGHLPSEETHQSLDRLSSKLQQKIHQYRPMWATITRMDLENYLATQNKVSLLDYCKELKPSYRHIERVFFRADASPTEWDLTSLPNLEGRDFSYCVFNNCRFGGSLKGTRWQHSYLRDADFSKVTSVEQADFSEAHLEFLKAPGINFKDSIFVQAQLQYADLHGANLMNVHSLGAQWCHANLDNIETTEREHLTELKEAQIILVGQHANALYQIRIQQEAQQQHIQDLRNDLYFLQNKGATESSTDASIEVKSVPDFNKLEELTASLLQEQQARLALSRYCQSELSRLSQQTEMAQLIGQENKMQIANLEQDIKTLQKQQIYFSQFIQETHTLTERVSRNEIKVNELDAHLAQLERNFGERLVLVESRLDLLQLQFASAVNQFKNETLPELIAALKIQAEHVANAMDLSQLEDFYIPLTASRSRNYAIEGKDAITIMDEFLFHPTRKKERVCLLFGDAGSGKTVFTLKLQEHLWSDSELSTGSSLLIPLWIEMKRFNKSSAEDCINTILKSDYHFSDDAIRRLKESEHQFIFIFDGYDELAGGGVVKLYQANRLGEWGRNPKMIVGCRTGYLNEHVSRGFLGPGGEENDTQISECYLMPLNANQISDYLTKREANNELEGHSKEDYEQCLRKIPGLGELINTPFLLKIYISAFRQFKDRTSQISPVELYDAFMGAWFAKESQKLIDSLGTLEGDIQKAFLQFSRRLAFAMYEAYMNEVHYSVETENPWEVDLDEDEIVRAARTAAQHQISQKWEQFFSDKDETTVQVRRGCPLRRLDANRYGFVHQSFLEYFVADSLWDALMSSSGKLLTKWGSRCLTKEPKMTAVVQFLSNRMNIHPNKDIAQTKLYQLIHASKSLDVQMPDSEKERILQAASNAMTVLNFGLVSFSLKAKEEPTFFRDIQVPYADLSMAELSGVDLTNANLSHTRMVGAKLSHAKLDGTDLTGLDVKQFPMLRFEHPIQCVAHSKDGRWMVIAMKEKLQIYRRSLLHWKMEKEWSERKPILSLAFAPNSMTFASGRQNNSIRIWSSEGQLLLDLIEYKNSVTSLAYSIDNSLLASGSSDNTVRVWHEDGKLFTVLKGHKKHVTCVNFSPQGHDIIVSGSKDKTVRLWNLVEQHLSFVLAKNGASVTTVRFSVDGLQVAVAGFDKKIRFFNLQGELVSVFTGHTDIINDFIFLPNDEYIASAAVDKTIRIWRVIDATVAGVLEGHTGSVRSLAYSKIDNQLVSGSEDQTIRLWGVDNINDRLLYNAFASMMAGHSAEVNSVSFSFDGRFVVSGGKDDTLRVWSIDGIPKIVLEGHMGSIISVVCSPNCYQWVSVSYDKTLRIWQHDDLTPIVVNMPGIPSSVAYSPSGKYLILSYADRIELLLLDDIMQGRKLNPLVINQKSLRNIQRSESRRFGQTVRIVRSSKSEVKDRDERINSVAFSPNEEQIAIASSDNTVRVCNIYGQLLNVYLGHSDEVTALSFSPSGKLLASGGVDNSVRIWGITSDIHQTLIGHTEPITSVSFASTGFLLASGSYDASIRIWGDGLLQAVLKGHKEAVTGVSFSPISTTILVSCSWDKTVILWSQVSVGDWLPMWQHPRDSRLVMMGASVDKVFGLTPLNQKLFEQLYVVACSRRFRDGEPIEKQDIVTPEGNLVSGRTPTSSPSSNLSAGFIRGNLLGREYTLFGRKTLRVPTPTDRSLNSSEHPAELTENKVNEPEVILTDLNRDSDARSSDIPTERGDSNDIVARASPVDVSMQQAPANDILKQPPVKEPRQRCCCSIF